jgi:hypothetical protein
MKDFFLLDNYEEKKIQKKPKAFANVKDDSSDGGFSNRYFVPKIATEGEFTDAKEKEEMKKKWEGLQEKKKEGLRILINV